MHRKTHPIRMAILDMNNNVENMGIASIKRIADRFAVIDYDIFDVRNGFEVPGLDYDIYVSSGGPGDPLETDSRWDQAYFELIDRIWAYNQTHEHKKFVFFICHSFQMICNHWKIGKITKRMEESFGIVPVDKTEAGEADMLLAHLNDPFYGADFRKYQVVEPDMDRLDEMGAEITAMEALDEIENNERALMAIRFSDEFYATQFHPEAHPDGMIHYLRRAEKKEMIIDQFGLQVYEEMMHNALHPQRLAETRDQILPVFLRRAMDHIYECANAAPVLA